MLRQTTLNRPFAGFNLLAGTALALALSAGSAFAADAPADAPAAAANPAEAIVVIGTRRLDRSSTNSASPIDVISAGELTSQPVSNMLDAVKNIVPSFFVGQNSISDASTFVRAPSLRGLPSDEILVMFNGKRYNRSALVQVYNGGDTGLAFGSQGSDISAIPSIAIRNLEVLRDGATAQYGSDAIGGVLNYGLREDAGLEVVGRFGEYYKGDGKSYDIAANAGLKNDRGFINVSGEYSDDAQTSRGATRPTALAFASENPSLANTLPNYPLPAQIWGSSPTHGYKILVNAAYELTDVVKAYAFGNIAHAKADESFNFRSSLVGSRPFTTTAGGTDNLGGRSFFQHPYYLTQCPTGNATCPTGGYVQDSNVWNLSSIYPGGFTPRFVGVTDEAYGVVGIKGATKSNLRYDVSASLSQNKLTLSMYDSISPSYGKDSQTSFQFGANIQKEFDLNADLSYEVNAGLASPITLSWGAEYRSETFEATAGDLQSYGAGPYAVPHELYTQVSPGVYQDTGKTTAAESPAASGYGGTSPTYAGSHTQKSWGLYGNAETDVTKAFSIGAAARYEHYTSFGGRGVFKINGIYKFNDAISFRATAGTGFHAPSPGQDNAQVLTTNFIAGVSTQTGTFPVTSAIAQYYGAKSLAPETSTNFGAGFVFKPVRNASITIDGYSIKVNNRIYISQTYSVSQADITALPELASVGAGGVVQYFTNAIDTRNQGVDIVGTWRTDLAGGKLDLTLAYNYNDISVTRAAAGTISAAEIIDAEHIAPNTRANLEAAWSHGKLSLNAIGHYYGKWQDAEDYPANGGSQVFGAKVTADFSATYKITPNYIFTVGANNLFDTYPDKIAASAANHIYTATNSLADGQIYPRNGGPFGFNGGFFYARLKVKY